MLTNLHVTTKEQDAAEIARLTAMVADLQNQIPVQTRHNQDSQPHAGMTLLLTDTPTSHSQPNIQHARVLTFH